MKKPPVIEIEGFESPEDKDAVLKATLDVWAEGQLAVREERKQVAAAGGER